MKRREFRHISDALAKVRGSATPATVLAAVQEVWPQAVGEGVAANAVPTGESDGVLQVSCSSSVWAQELELLSADLVTRINAKLTGPVLKTIRCKVGPAGQRPPGPK